MNDGKNKESSSIFRQKSVKQLSGPEDLNDYIRVTTPSVWIVLAALAVLLVGLLLWSIFGTLEVRGADGAVEFVHPISYIVN